MQPDFSPLGSAICPLDSHDWKFWVGDLWIDTGWQTIPRNLERAIYSAGPAGLIGCFIGWIWYQYPKMVV